MKVILVREMKKLGQEGKVVDVKDGYARNFLLPGGFALPATKENLKRIESIKQERLKNEQKVTEKAHALKEMIEKISLTITAEVKDEEDIYGSIGQQQIVKALQDEGVDSELITIELAEPLRKLGAYSVTVQLAPKIDAQLRVWVVKK